MSKQRGDEDREPGVEPPRGGTDEVASLRRSQETLRELHRVSTEGDRSPEERLRSMLEVGRKRLGVANAYLSRTDVESDDYRVIEAVGPGDLEPGMSADLSETYCRRTIESEDLLAVSDAATDPEWSDDVAYRTFDLRCYAGERVVVDGELYGTVCFSDPGGREPFSEDEVALVELVVDWIERELERAELDRQRRILGQSLEEADTSVVLTDPSEPGNPIVYANSGFLELTGYDEEEVLGENCRMLQGEDTDGAATARIGEAVGAGESVTETVKNYRKDGTPFWNQVEVSPITDDDGDLVRFVGSQRDVTESVERREVLASLLARSRDLLDAADRAAVYRTAGEAVDDVLGVVGVLRRYDPETDRLSVAAATEAGSTGGLGPVAVGEGLAGRAFEAGEPLVYPDDADADDARRRSAPGNLAAGGSIDAGIVVPLGDHGVLGLARGEGEFGDFERRVAELLGAIVETALDRARRREQLRRYEEVVEVGRDMILVVDGDLSVTLSTERLAAHLGYDREELEGRSATDLFADDEAAIRERIAGAVATGDLDGTAVETELVGADGTTRPVELEVTVRDTGAGATGPAGRDPAAGDGVSDGAFAGAVVVVRDIAELEETRARLDRERDRFRKLFEHLPDPVDEVAFEDGEPVIRRVNDAFEDVFGYEAETVVGESANEFVLPPDTDHRAGYSDLDASVMDGDVVSTEVRRRTTDGTRDFLFRGIPLSSEGSVESAFGIYTDVTDQHRRERRLQVLNRVLRHNVRNRMTVVEGYGDLLVDRLSDESVAVEGADADRLVRAAREVRAAAERVTDLSEEARVAADVTDRSPEPADPVELVRSAVDSVAGDHPGATVAFDPPPGTVPPVRVPDGFEVAVEQLVENGVVHDDGDPRVAVEVAVDEERVAVRVADEGPGIEPGEAAVVAGDREISQLTHGSGLGLWVVRWLVDAADGTVEFERPPSGGTTAVVSLRRADR